MKALVDRLAPIASVKTATLDLEEPFVDVAARFAHEPGTVVLLSGGDLDCSRYHILGLRPWLTLVGRCGTTTAVVDGATVAVSRAPLDVLDAVVERCRLVDSQVAGPVAAGLFGYLAYDLKDDLESLPRTSVDDLGLPHLYMAAPALILVHDKRHGSTRLHAPVREGEADDRAQIAIDGFVRSLDTPFCAPGGATGTGQSLRSNCTRSDYIAAVQRIKDYIAAGDVYQVNLSQRFETQIAVDGYQLFKALYALNPAPFFAFVNAGDHQIVSTSPERFLLREGCRVETRPIKGTRPRGQTPAKDQAMQAELAASAKDDAELSMIVDLLRNDIGRVCAGGSVKVTQHKRLEAYQNVYHLVSVVEGVLAEGSASVDLIRATFPGGSITGCPKIRSMEIIDELESHRRHIYTGSIGYISFHDTMDLSIAIRTATIVGDRLIFSVGGGIIYDSNPEDEYEETLHKGRSLMTVLQDQGNLTTSEGIERPWVWLNGRLLPQDRATVSVTDFGLQYGFGFFETIRVENGRARHLPAHLERFARSWTALFATPPPDLTWERIIGQVVDKNGLSGSVAAVKVLATRGNTCKTGFNGTLLVTARPYVHRLAGLERSGLKLATYPHPHLTPLADHKTLNYLFYHQAGDWARRQGADEALILNPDATVSETNTANLLIVSGRTVIRPLSPHVLPGVMQAQTCRRLSKLGYSILERSVRPDEIWTAEALLLTNSLMGVVPALSLDGRSLQMPDAALDAILNRSRIGPRQESPGSR